MISLLYRRISPLIFLLLLHFLHGYEYYEEGPSTLLLFVQKNGIDKRISDRGIVIIPEDRSQRIPDGTIVLSYYELVNMYASGHFQSEMKGLYYFDVNKYYIGSRKASVKEIIDWGKKAKNHERNSARIVLAPISMNPIVFNLHAFRNIRHTLSYDFNTISKLGKSGKLRRDSPALLVIYDKDWYEQGSIGSLVETYLNMDSADQKRSKFYLITDILGKNDKHFDKVTISSGDIPIVIKKLPVAEPESTISESNMMETFAGAYSPFEMGVNQDAYYNDQQIPITMMPGMIPPANDIPWMGGQVDMSYMALQTPSIMVPINIQDLIAGSMVVGGSLFAPQVPQVPLMTMAPRPHPPQSKRTRKNQSFQRSIHLSSPELDVEIESPVKLSDPNESPYVNPKGLVSPIMRTSNFKDTPLRPWWHAKPKMPSQMKIKKLVDLKQTARKSVKASKKQHKPSNLNGFVVLFPRRLNDSEGVIVVPDQRSHNIDSKDTKLITIGDIFDMKAKNLLLNSDMFVYFLPNKNFTKITIGSGDVNSILTSKDNYFLDNWNRTKAFQITAALTNQTLSIHNFQIYNDTKSYTLNELESGVKNESAIAIFEDWFTQDTVDGLLKWYHANRIAAPFVKVFYLNDLLNQSKPITTITVTPNNSTKVEVPLPRNVHVYVKKSSKNDSLSKAITIYKKALKPIKELLKKSGILISSPSLNHSDGVVFIPKSKTEGDLYFYTSGFTRLPRHISVDQLDKMWTNMDVDDTDIILFIGSDENKKLTTVEKLIPSIRSGSLRTGQVFIIGHPENRKEKIVNVFLGKKAKSLKLDDIGRLLNNKAIHGFDRVLIKNSDSFVLDNVFNLNSHFKKGQLKDMHADIYILKNKGVWRVPEALKVVKTNKVN